MIQELVSKILSTIDLKLNKFLGSFLYIAQVNDISLNEEILVTATNIDNGESINIKQMLGIGIGNSKGIYNYPSKGDLILVLDLFGHQIMLGSVLDIYTSSRDNPILIDDDEMILVPKTNGSYIKFNKDGKIQIISRDGAKIKVETDGSFKLFDKKNYGIQSDGDGNITIYGNLNVQGTSSSTGIKTSGNW